MYMFAHICLRKCCLSKYKTQFYKKTCKFKKNRKTTMKRNAKRSFAGPRSPGGPAEAGSAAARRPDGGGVWRKRPEDGS